MLYKHIIPPRKGTIQTAYREVVYHMKKHQNSIIISDGTKVWNKEAYNCGVFCLGIAPPPPTRGWQVGNQPVKSYPLHCSHISHFLMTIREAFPHSSFSYVLNSKVEACLCTWRGHGGEIPQGATPLGAVALVDPHCFHATPLQSMPPSATFGCPLEVWNPCEASRRLRLYFQHHKK